MNKTRGRIASLLAVTLLASAAGLHAQSIPKTLSQPATGSVAGAETRLQDQVETLMTAYLGVWSTGNPGSYDFARFVTDDAVFEYPYADDGSRRLEGRTAIDQAVSGFPATATDWTFSDLRVFPTLYPDTFFVEYTGKAYVPATHRRYESTYLGRMTVRDGKIAEYYELWEVDARDAAFGLARTD
ncbi:MAG: nuclear transport factor 2 family protein [Betaproteobacteria bacterium]